MAPRLDSVTNCMIIFSCLVVVGLLLEQRLGRTSTREEADYAPGEAMDYLPGIDYGDSHRTLVLSLRSTCEFCTASMPFYKTLLETRSPAMSPRVVAVSFEKTEVTEAYLKDHGVRPDVVVTAVLRSQATPRLILVDNLGRVEATWLGKLAPSREADVLSVLLGEEG